MRPIIQRLKAKNYGCLKDLELEFAPLHCLVGPNDSGKSTILNAVRLLVESVIDSYSHLCSKHRHETFLGIFLNGMKNDVSLKVTTSTGHHHRLQAMRQDEVYISQGTNAPGSRSETFNVADNVVPKNLSLLEAMGGARLCRFDPDRLALPCKLIPDGSELELFDERGFGLPGIYDALMNRNLDGYIKIVDDVRGLFPTVKKLRPQNISDSEKALGIELLDGQVVPAKQMSAGLLYYLAFAALPYLESTSVILIEEPENGLHPARIADVVRVLREVSRTTQIIVATHSPLVLNELQPEEVSVVTRDTTSGTKVTPLKDTPNFEERAKVYALGELWVSYANGDDEGPLLTPTEATRGE